MHCSSNDSASSSCGMFRYALNPGSSRFVGLRFSILDGSLSGFSIHIVCMSSISEGMFGLLGFCVCLSSCVLL